MEQSALLLKMKSKILIDYLGNYNKTQTICKIAQLFSDQKCNATFNGYCSLLHLLVVFCKIINLFQHYKEINILHNLAVSVTYSRKKGMFNRDKLKLYLKINCDTTPEGVWKVKERLVKKYNLNEASFTDVYPGPPPSFGKSEISKRGPRKKTVAMMEKVAKKLKKAEKQKKKGELIIIFMTFKLGGVE